jgi:hypothetical protein
MLCATVLYPLSEQSSFDLRTICRQTGALFSAKNPSAV